MRKKDKDRIFKILDHVSIRLRYVSGQIDRLIKDTVDNEWFWDKLNVPEDLRADPEIYFIVTHIHAIESEIKDDIFKVNDAKKYIPLYEKKLKDLDKLKKKNPEYYNYTKPREYVRDGYRMNEYQIYISENRSRLPEYNERIEKLNKMEIPDNEQTRRIKQFPDYELYLYKYMLDTWYTHLLNALPERIEYLQNAKNDKDIQYAESLLSFIIDKYYNFSKPSTMNEYGDFWNGIPMTAKLQYLHTKIKLSVNDITSDAINIKISIYGRPNINKFNKYFVYTDFWDCKTFTKEFHDKSCDVDIPVEFFNQSIFNGELLHNKIIESTKLKYKQIDTQHQYNTIQRTIDALNSKIDGYNAELIKYDNNLDLMKHINAKIKKLVKPLKYANELINNKKMTGIEMQIAFIKKYPEHSRNIR